MKIFTSKTQKIGKIGEDIASKFLMKRGFEVVERNYTKPFGEIDIIAKKAGILHFVEIKSVTREMDAEEDVGVRAEENLHKMKFRRLANTVSVYLSEKNVSREMRWQIDLIVVEVDLVNNAGKLRFFNSVNLD